MKFTQINKIIELSEKTKAELEDCRKDMKEVLPLSYVGELLAEKQKERGDKAVAVYHKNRTEALELVEEIAEAVEKAKNKAINDALGSDDIKLLQLPLSLTKDELREMGQRNADNSFIIRAVEQKAKEQEINLQDLQLPTVENPDYTLQNIRTATDRLFPNYSEWISVEGILNTGLTRSLTENGLAAYGK